MFALTLGTPIGITGVDARTSEEDLGRWIALGEKAAAEHINDKSIARPKSAVMLMIAGVRTWHAPASRHRWQNITLKVEGVRESLVAANSQGGRFTALNYCSYQRSLRVGSM